MVPFKDVLTGVEKRDYTRAVDFQRSLRVAGKHNDFEEVGRTPRHHTLFEMLGNWSFGDYFKREAIHWAWEFLTHDLGIPRRAARGDGVLDRRLRPRRLARRDRAAARAPRPLGRFRRRATRRTGGGWPTSGRAARARSSTTTAVLTCPRAPECVPDHSEHCPRWLEIWNLVFMEFELHADRSLTPLPAPGVDTGMGLERMASVVQQVYSNRSVS